MELLPEENISSNNYKIEYNKTFTYNYMINRIPYYLDICFNTNNTLLNLFYACDYSNDISFRIIRNLHNSKFAYKYISFENLNKYDSDGMFYDVKNGFKFDRFKKDSDVRLLFTDTIRMNESDKNNLPNYLYTRGYGLNEYKHQYVFIFIERSKYYSYQNCIKTRTAAIEIYNSKLNPDNLF